ncbi:MAG: GAF domain-containing protein, partial [Algoriella sp.]
SKPKSQVSFQNVYPIYGEIDVRNSSFIRNNCMRIDYKNQLDYLIQICEELFRRTQKDKFLEYIDQLKDFSERIHNVDKIYFESELFDYIAINIHPEIPKYVKEDEKSIITEYLEKLDSTTGLFYIERKKFDQSISMINSLLSNKLDIFQLDAQNIFPHYYERFKTDGIDYNLYVGRSIAPQKKFSYQDVKKIRFWQLQANLALEQAYNNIREKVPIEIDVASLILATNNTLDIIFKLDEKRFDVNGYNNAKYEIIKKRISKAFIKDSTERINQPGKICVIYTEDVLREEYAEYFKLLIAENYLKDDIEYLEVNDLQGINGLLAIRASINYRKEVTKYIELKD